VPLIVIESPSRAAAEALIQYVQFQQRTDGVQRTQVSVAIPETAPTHWWDVFVRNYLGSRLKVALLSRPEVSVWSIPLLLKD